MSKRLDDLLLTIRQHSAFQEMLDSVEAPTVKPFRMSEIGKTAEQHAEWIFRSGRAHQHQEWLTFFTSSSKEK